MLTTGLTVFTLLCLCATLYFMFVSIREKEPRAPYFGLVGALFHMLLIPVILWVPLFKIPIIILFSVYILFFLACCIQGKENSQALKGTMGYVRGEVHRFDERDTMFARIEGLHSATDRYNEYYQRHPEHKKSDDKRRSGGFPIGPPGAIDQYSLPVMAMAKANFHTCFLIGNHAVAKPSPDAEKKPLPPEKTTQIIKKFALHLGADLVGICKTNPLWSYSHRGEVPYEESDEYGKKLPESLPYALVFTVEMSHEHVSTAPHTPAVAESMTQYCKGEYISTILAQWFSSMGYRGAAQHFLHYDHLMVPMAVDAGLGELGRQGYLIAPKFGCRVRVFATMTDMPLVPDKPISIGVDTFCRRCKKCAISCPSKSIPRDEKTLYNGVEKWKLHEKSCYTFWGKVGTDCAICMSICPFSRPDSPIHRVVRWMVARSLPAQTVFPFLDNILYGKRWHPKKISSWLDYPRKNNERY